MWKSKKNKKQQQRLLPPPPVVSTYCSSLKSRLFLHNLNLFRRVTPKSRPETPSPSPAKPTSSNSPLSSLSRPHLKEDDKPMARAYWERIQRLEQELADLEKWFKSAERNNHLHSAGTRNSMGDGDGNRLGFLHELVTLEDGSCIKKLRRGLNKKSQELVLQMSASASVEAGSIISQVLTNMASMGMETLIESLEEAMPMCDITRCKIDDIRRKAAAAVRSKHKRVAGGGVREEIIGCALERIEELAMEGLKIHASNHDNRSIPAHECIDPAMAMSIMNKKKKNPNPVLVHVMLIQIRDAMKHFEEVGDPMIALVEVSTIAPSGAGGRKESKVEGVCVAGLRLCVGDDDGDDDFVWSVSWKDSGNHRFLRNRNIACTKKKSSDFVCRKI